MSENGFTSHRRGVVTAIAVAVIGTVVGGLILAALTGDAESGATGPDDPTPTPTKPAVVQTNVTELPVVGAFYTGYTSDDDASFVGFEQGVIEAGGDPYANSLYHQGMDAETTAFVQYNLSGDYSTLHFVAAVSDDASTSTRVRFEVYLDNVRVRQVDVRWGKPTPIEPVELTGKLRLKLRLTRLDSGESESIAGFGEAVVER